jgi:hypothetical protein
MLTVVLGTGSLVCFARLSSSSRPLVVVVSHAATHSSAIILTFNYMLLEKTIRHLRPPEAASIFPTSHSPLPTPPLTASTKDNIKINEKTHFLSP